MGGEVCPKIKFKPPLQLGTAEYVQLKNKIPFTTEKKIEGSKQKIKNI